MPKQAYKYPEIIARIIKDDHIIGSHFLEHRRHIIDTKSVFLNSLNESVEQIETLSQHRIEYCRAPYGSLMPWQESWIKKSKYKHVFWSLDSKDYKLETRENIISRVRNNFQSDDIVLLHDGEASHPEIVQIVEECLKSLNLEL